MTLHHDTQSCMDPNVIEAEVVVSSCGHDGPMGAHSVKRLSKLGMVPDVPGMAALDMNKVRGPSGVLDDVMICMLVCRYLQQRLPVAIAMGLSMTGLLESTPRVAACMVSHLQV